MAMKSKAVGERVAANSDPRPDAEGNPAEVRGGAKRTQGPKPVVDGGIVQRMASGAGSGHLTLVL
jgi:hypothetical protein